jgi:DNA recombination protein RmuC
VVDSKTPLSAYLEALDAPDETARRERLLAHATQVRNHMKALCAKSYQEQFHPTPDFVVMFLPGEFLFSSALEQMPDLIEVGVDQKVIPASPTTLIALLRAVAYGWQQASLAENAQKISALGKRLYESIRVMAGHMEKLGDSLSNSVKKYNDTVGSLERNVLTSARKFPELGVASTEEIAELEPKEDAVRALQSPDWESSEQAKLDI